MTEQHSPRQFEMEIDIDAPRDAVWKAIADADETARWFAPDVTIEPGVGGQVVWDWAGHFHWPQTIEAWEPGRYLKTRYDSAVDDGQGGKRPLFVEFHLEGDSGTTTLRVVNHGFDEDARFDDEFDGISRGWPVELEGLRHYLERHRGTDRVLAWATGKSKLGEAATWTALCGADGLDATELNPTASPGDSFRFELPGVGPIEGRVLRRSADTDFTGIVPELEDGVLRVWVGEFGGGTSIWVWLACYGVARARVDEYQRAFDAALARLEPVFSGGATAREGA